MSVHGPDRYETEGRKSLVELSLSFTIGDTDFWTAPAIVYDEDPLPLVAEAIVSLPDTSPAGDPST